MEKNFKKILNFLGKFPKFRCISVPWDPDWWQKVSNFFLKGGKSNENWLKFAQIWLKFTQVFPHFLQIWSFQVGFLLLAILHNPRKARNEIFLEKFSAKNFKFWGANFQGISVSVPWRNAQIDGKRCPMQSLCQALHFGSI